MGGRKKDKILLADICKMYYTKITKNGARHFCVWTCPDTMGLVQARRAEKGGRFPMKKRIFAILLALVMLLGALPVTAMAADDVSKVVKSAFTTWDTYKRALVLTNNIAEPVYATVVVKPGETITDFGNLVFFTTGGHALSSGFSNTLRWNYTPDVVDLNVVEDGGTLRVSFTGKQEGTAKVKLNYWTSYYFPDSQTGSGVTAHCSGDIYYNLIVSNDPVDLNGKPEKPDDELLDEYVDGNGYGVYLSCRDSDNENYYGSNYASHNLAFPSVRFKTDGYSIGEVVKNDGSYINAPTSTYSWMCDVTVYGQPYVDHYNKQKGPTKGTHYLKGSTTKTFTLFYSQDDLAWNLAIPYAPVTFQITRTAQSMNDIILSYDGGDHAADKVTGIPASETKRVNTGAKAKFTVSSDVPTCGCGKDCTFLGWKLDGDTKLYVGGDAIELSTSATLHAQWREGSGGDDNEPTNPPSSGENGDIEKALYGKNVTVRCVNNENAHEEKPYDAKLGLTSASPVKIDAGLTLGETTYKTAYEIKLSADKFVDLYSKSTAEGGSGEAHHRKDGTAAELTWIIYWDASLPTDNKWAAYENDQKIVEAEHTVTEPTTPPSTEELRPLLGKVEVDCVDRTVKHDTLEYDAVDGLVEGSLQKVAGGYQTGSGQHYDTAYTCTLSGAKFAQLYSGKTTDTPAGSGVAHTLKTPETITCTVAWNPSEGKWFAVKETSVIQTTHAEYTVTFKYQVNGYSDKTQTVVAGSTVTKPADERREGYTLEGWYETADCTGEKFNFSTPINANKILYAKWTAKRVPYTIRHRDKDTNETVAPDTTGTGAYGEKITLTPKTDIADYVPAEGNPQYSWLTSEVGNIFTLRYVKLFTVSFDCHMDGMTIAAKTVQRNAKVTSPDTLTRTGYAFGGWYKSLSDAAAYDFDTPVTESFTLHAKWTARTDIPYTVKYVDQDTNVVLKTENKTGTFNETVHESAIQISGYTAVAPTSKDLKLENVSGNELIFYYTKDPVKVSYTVHYYLDGTTTKVAADKVVNNVNAGTEVTEDAISVTGYTAAAPTQQKLNLSATGTNEIIFYYTKNVGTQVAYTIRYLKEGTGEALLPAYSGTGVVGNSLTVTAPAIDGYTALAPTSYTITLNAEAAKNIITFYYREATSTIPAGEPAKEPFNKNANPRQLNRDDHFAYIKGYPDGTVRPEASLTRAEAAAILYRVMEKSCVERFHAESSSFRDVPDGKWYTTYVATLEKAGVIVDSKDGNFRPNDAITRAELASMLAQFANVTGGTNMFSDVPATHWAADYIAAAVRSGWIQGYPDGTFRPEQTIKRAEMTAMVNRALGRDPQSASDLLEGMKTWKDNADPTAWFYLDIQEAANGHTYARKTGGEYWTGLVADVVQ